MLKWSMGAYYGTQPGECSFGSSLFHPHPHPRPHPHPLPLPLPHPHPGECFFAASDIGWVVGSSYIVYGPLLHGCKSVMFEGKPVGTPDAATYWRLIQEHGVTNMFTVRASPSPPRARAAGPC